MMNSRKLAFGLAAAFLLLTGLALADVDPTQVQSVDYESGVAASSEDSSPSSLGQFGQAEVTPTPAYSPAQTSFGAPLTSETQSFGSTPITGTSAANQD